MAGIFPRPFKLFIVPESTIGKHHQKDRRTKRAVVLKKLLLYPPPPATAMPLGMRPSEDALFLPTILVVVEKKAGV
jgi:hypothetical protein